MWGRILTLLTIIAGIVQQIIRNRDKKRAELEGKDREDQIKEIEDDPSDWFARHFGEGTTVVVRPPPPCEHDGVPEDDGLPSGDSTGEANVGDPSGRDGRDVS